jgi:hypothetical protein
VIVWLCGGVILWWYSWRWDRGGRRGTARNGQGISGCVRSCGRGTMMIAHQRLGHDPPPWMPYLGRSGRSLEGRRCISSWTWFRPAQTASRPVEHHPGAPEPCSPTRSQLLIFNLVLPSHSPPLPCCPHHLRAPKSHCCPPKHPQRSTNKPES